MSKRKVDDADLERLSGAGEAEVMHPPAGDVAAPNDPSGGGTSPSEESTGGGLGESSPGDLEKN